MEDNSGTGVDPSPSGLACRASAEQPVLSVLGEMTGGIAHDLKNILAVIDSGLRFVERNVGDPDMARAFIAGAREGIDRGVRLTSQLLTFARQRELATAAADVNALLANLELS